MRSTTSYHHGRLGEKTTLQDAPGIARRGLDVSGDLRGKRYEAEKKAEGGRADRDVSGGHCAHPKTAEKLAAEYDVDEKTIRRDASLDLTRAGAVGQDDSAKTELAGTPAK